MFKITHQCTWIRHQSLCSFPAEAVVGQPLPQPIDFYYELDYDVANVCCSPSVRDLAVVANLISGSSQYFQVLQHRQLM